VKGGSMKIGRLSGVSLLLAGSSLAFGTLASRPTQAEMSREKRLAIIKSVPLIVTLAQKDGKILGIASFGSGTVVTKQGHILTNNHVISFNHPLPEGITIVPERYVFMTFENNSDPKPVCTFDPSHMPHDTVVDIAMVKCEHDIKGNDWDNKLVWDAVNVGDPAAMVQGDDLWVFGYPGAGQDPRKKNVDFFTLPSMNVSEGKFSGVVNEQDTETTHHISWVKTDAEISGGNSGGCATDDDGNYIGIPTEVHTDTRESQGGDGGTLGHVGFLRPTNLLKTYIDMANKGWMPGDSTGDGGGDQAVPAGDGVIVTGGVVSADTGDPVPNIVIVVFKDGVTAAKVMAAKDPSEFIQTRGKTGADGQFTLEDRVPKGSYTVAVIGQGYKLVIEDNALVVDANTAQNYHAWNRIPVTRCSSGADCIN
jgi:hypothetical protein